MSAQNLENQIENQIENQTENKEKGEKIGVFSQYFYALIKSGKLCGWQSFFEAQAKLEYFEALEEFLNVEYGEKTIFPAIENLFNAFLYCDTTDVKLVILGQDPYHEENQAMGLAFSVPKTQKIPPSLRNIFAEMKSDIGVSRTHGDISDLAKKGVFLLNTVLSVEKGNANSHAKKGWEIFTKSALCYLCEKSENLLFILLGKPAEKFESIAKNHRVIKTSHPSPLSAYRGFLGSGIFGKANEILEKYGKNIDWNEEG